MEVLISKITMCQSPEERKNNIIKEEVESISAEALISILIVKRISIVRNSTACQNPSVNHFLFFYVCWRVSKLCNFVQLCATCDSASKQH